MKWLLGCGILFALALTLFVVPATLEGPVLVPISQGHGLSLVDAVALVPLLAATALLAGGLWRRRQASGRRSGSAALAGQGRCLRGRPRVGSAGRVGVRVLLVVGDRRDVALGGAPGGRRRGRPGARGLVRELAQVRAQGDDLLAFLDEAEPAYTSVGCSLAVYCVHLWGGPRTDRRHSRPLGRGVGLAP